MKTEQDKIYLGGNQVKLRHGRHRNRMVYLQGGEVPDNNDPFVIFAETDAVAEIIVKSINNDPSAIFALAKELL